MTAWNKITFVLVSTIVVFTTLAYGAVHQPVIALTYILIAAAAIIWAIDVLKGGVLIFSRHRLQIPLLLYGGYALVQTIAFGTFSEPGGIVGIPRTISLEPFATQAASVQILFLSIFFALTLYSLASAARLRRIVAILTIFGFLYAFYAVLQSVLSPDRIYGIYKPQAATPFGSFVNRHDFAAVIEMLIALPLGMLFAGSVQKDRRLIYVVTIALMGTSILLSGSRGGLVALIAEILVLIIVTARARGRKKIVIKTALAATLVITSVGGAIFVGGDTSLTRFATAGAEDDPMSSRMHIWAVTFAVIKDNLPLGAGVGAFAQAYTKVDTASGFERIEQAHNDYLQVLADAGLIGLVLGGLFLFLFFREGSKNIRTDNRFRRGVAAGAFAGCFAILVHSAFDFVLHITAISLLFITLLSILIASGRKYVDDLVDGEDEQTSIHRKPATVTPITERI